MHLGYSKLLMDPLYEVMESFGTSGSGNPIVGAFEAAAASFAAHKGIPNPKISVPIAPTQPMAQKESTAQRENIVQRENTEQSENISQKQNFAQRDNISQKQNFAQRDNIVQRENTSQKENIQRENISQKENIVQRENAAQIENITQRDNISQKENVQRAAQVQRETAARKDSVVQRESAALPPLNELPLPSNTTVYPPPVIDESDADRTRLLHSWYWAGYYVGLADGKRIAHGRGSGDSV